MSQSHTSFFSSEPIFNHPTMFRGPLLTRLLQTPYRLGTATSCFTALSNSSSTARKSVFTTANHNVCSSILAFQPTTVFIDEIVYLLPHLQRRYTIEFWALLKRIRRRNSGSYPHSTMYLATVDQQQFFETNGTSSTNKWFR